MGACGPFRSQPPSASYHRKEKKKNESVEKRKRTTTRKATGTRFYRQVTGVKKTKQQKEPSCQIQPDIIKRIVLFLSVENQGLDVSLLRRRSTFNASESRLTQSKLSFVRTLTTACVFPQGGGCSSGWVGEVGE